MAEKYLLVITTVLVITQLIRLIQNAVNLKRQNKLINKQLEGLGDVTRADFDRQRKYYEMAIEYMEGKQK